MVIQNQPSLTFAAHLCTGTDVPLPNTTLRDFSRTNPDSRLCSPSSTKGLSRNDNKHPHRPYVCTTRQLSQPTLAAHATSIDSAGRPHRDQSLGRCILLQRRISAILLHIHPAGIICHRRFRLLEGTFSFSFIDDVTVNGVTAPITIYGDDHVTTTYDTLSIYASGPMQIGDATWSLRPMQATGYNIQPYDIALTADVASGVTPEPAGLLLLGTGALATALTVRKRLFCFG